ncbi:hypothetical protein VIGAN_09025800 [Vigna angularis var. angularis]|uniref:BHLH domain-containing protein n=1 Tax=Vigna angularis var. angularis TaxID=157739 RepID=A0A0S3SVU8_PHAAN|nr:hypothetical protein VIGAN_09025800 [Vigna angularis var. angularis]
MMAPFHMLEEVPTPNLQHLFSYYIDPTGGSLYPSDIDTSLYDPSISLAHSIIFPTFQQDNLLPSPKRQKCCCESEVQKLTTQTALPSSYTDEFVVPYDNFYSSHIEELPQQISVGFAQFHSTCEDLKCVKKETEKTISPQSLAARERRRKISEKTQELGKLVPGGPKMNTAEMLHAAAKYVKYLQAQVNLLELTKSLAFLKAWQSSCGAQGMATLVIPANYRFLLSPLMLKGPCHASNIQIQIRGKVIAAEKNAWASYKYTWILISNVNGLTVDGSGGSLDGFGSSWWSCRNCPRPSDGSGYARGITFEEITLIQTRNPIIINQFYTNNGVSLKNGGVEVRGITFRGFHGTSMTGEAITLNCGPQGCFNITLDQINIASSQQGKPASCSCKNAHGTATSSVPNCPCLMP